MAEQTKTRIQQNLSAVLDVRSYNASHLAQPTNFRAMLASGKLLFGTACRIPSHEAARIVATLPHHFCFIDAEHTPLSPHLLTEIVRTINVHSGGTMVPVVRVPANATHLIAYALNAGAGAIVMPHVQNAAQARELVKWCRFPPNGERSYPPSVLFGDQTNTPPLKTVFDVWDENVAVLAQIEDQKGVDNIEEIVKVDGIDALMVGATDLRFATNILPRGSPDGDEPKFLANLHRIQQAANSTKGGMAILGFTATATVLERRIALGWRAFVGVGDAASISERGRAQWTEYWGLVDKIHKKREKLCAKL